MTDPQTDERRTARERLRIVMADLAARALRPASHGEVLALFLLLLGLGTVGLKVHSGDVARIGRDEHRIAEARAQSIGHSCEEANARHPIVKLELEGLVKRTTPRAAIAPTRAALKQQHVLLETFVAVIAPSYLAGRGTQAQREQQGCAQRVAEQTSPHPTKRRH